MRLSSKYINKKEIYSILINIDIIGIFVAVLFVIIFISILKPAFLTFYNFNVIVRSLSILGIVAISQMIILASGGMNLSVGAIGGLCAIITGIFLTKEVPVVLCILVGLFTGSFCGLINGWLIDRMGRSGFIAFFITLSTGFTFTGINLGICNAQPYYNLPEGFMRIGSFNIGGIPLLFLIMVIVAIFADFIFKHTSLGKKILATGGNPIAAENSGILVGRVIIICHVLGGLLAGMAGILLVARLGSAQPDIGSDWLMFSFAAPIIGGARLAGGKISTMGAILGAILLTLMRNALVHLNADVYWMILIEGLVILLAVSVERIRAIMAEKSEVVNHELLHEQQKR